VKDRFDQHLPRGNKVRGTKPTKKLGIIMVGLFCLFVGCHGQQSVMKLVAGEKKAISISTAKKNLMFKIAVPPSNIVTCHTTGTSKDSGDADLYANFGSEPNIYSELFSEGLFANETVGPLEASKTSARRLYVMVYAYTALKNVKLWCDLTQEPTPSSNSENPSENPSSSPTGCLAPGEDGKCRRTNSKFELNTRLCCSGSRCKPSKNGCCLDLGEKCTIASHCCSEHCVNKLCSRKPAAATEAQLSIQDP
jgi:hypothetical protein